MRVLLRLMLGLGVVLCAIALFQVVLAEPKLDMQLSAQRDAFCDGRAPMRANKTVAPDECILYRLELVNIGTEAAQQLNITTLIPEHTTLHHIARPINADYKIQAMQQADQATLHTYVERLETGTEQAISLRYTVKVK